jgi:hypothetical protein
MNGLYIVGVILGFYFLIILLLLSESFANKILPIYSYKLLSLKARFLKLYSLLTLSVLLIIHAGIYFLWWNFAKLFTYFSFIRPTPGSEDDPYITQVLIISLVVIFPYCLYTIRIIESFKLTMFKNLRDKFNVNFIVISVSNFYSKYRISSFIGFSFLDSKFLDFFQKNKENKDYRYKSVVSVDDVIFFPKQDLYVTELQIDNLEEKYEDVDDGKEWVRKYYKNCFDGLVIILNKDNYNKVVINSTFYKIKNENVILKATPSRRKLKHSFIEVMGASLGSNTKSVVLDSQSNDSKNLTFYSEINKDIAKIAEDLDVDYILEDEKNIFIFHNEKKIDFFTFYQNKPVNVSVDTFEEDFQYLVSISEKFQKLKTFIKEK